MKHKGGDLRRFAYAAFDDPHAAVAAASECLSGGHVVHDIFGPFPIHGVDELLGLRRSRMTWVCFLFGLTGLFCALWFQYWTSETDWPLNVGGKPFQSLPAFIPVAFELTVLFAGLGTVFVFLLRTRLLPGARSGAPSPGVTDDEFVVAVERRAGAGCLQEIWARHRALRDWEDVTP